MPRRHKKKASQKKTEDHGRDQVTLLILVLAILFILLVTAKLFSLFQASLAPWHLPPQNSLSFNWDDQESRNIIFVSFPSQNETRINVLNLSPKNKKVTILKLSDQIYTDLPNSFGNWPVGSAYQLGQENNQNLGPKLLTQTVEKLLGLPIDGLVILPDIQNTSIDNTLAEIRKNRLAFFQLFPKLKSTLSPIELTELFWTISKTRGDDVTDLDLASSNVTESKLLPDTSRVLGVNSVKLDLFVRENLSDDSINNEGKTVAILNATDHPGLTQDASRLVTNLGASVIITGNAETNVQKSLVITSDKNSATFKRLAQIYAPECLKKVCQSNDIKVIDSRSDITVVLGEDYSRLWSGK